MLIEKNVIMKAPLSGDIQREYSRLLSVIAPLSASRRLVKDIDGTGGKVSVADLVAYQIGWGKCVIRWYEEGVKGQNPLMPGDGFSVWDYTEIAKHFYEKYHFDGSSGQLQEFERVVKQILIIVEKEHQSGNLEITGVWNWCTLPSGKLWPLSKWIRVNTSSPYKRASTLISKVTR